MAQAKSQRPQSISLGLNVRVGFFIAAMWILFVGGVDRNEMLIGVAVLLFSSTFVYLLARRETLSLNFRWADLAACWRIPGYIVSKDWQIIVILVKDLLGIQRAGSFYRVCGFMTGKHDSLLVTRRVLATAYTTAAPNFIVIGIDCSQSRMLFHQLERGSVPQMTEELGAKPRKGRR